MQNVKFRDATSERSVATRSCSVNGWTAKRNERPRRAARPCVQKEAVGLISRQMAEGVGGEAGPGVPVKITTPP